MVTSDHSDGTKKHIHSITDRTNVRQSNSYDINEKNHAIKYPSDATDDRNQLHDVVVGFTRVQSPH